MPIQSVFPLDGYKLRKLLYNEIQTMFDQALFLNTNPHFKDCRWVKSYNRMVDTYGTCNSNEQTAQCWFDRLKTDQVSSVSIFAATSSVVKVGYRYWIVWTVRLCNSSNNNKNDSINRATVSYHRRFVNKCFSVKNKS